MKKLYISLAFLLLSQLSAAQIIFTYDNAGNRIHRQSGSATQLSLKVFLEGPMIDPSTMNGLQNTFWGSLLPQNSNYTQSPASYPAYANVNRGICDWVLVQIVAANDLNIVKEQKSLLLKTDGTIVGLDGFNTNLTFASQTNVRVAIRHRNHIAVFSNVISNLSGIINYDFTTGTNKAYAPSGYPDQQVAAFPGKYAMWTADVVNDNIIDGLDLAVMENDFPLWIYQSYIITDVNLDGVVDGIDLGYTQKNFDLSIYGNF